MIGSVRVLESRFVQSCTNITNAPQISNAEIAILGRSNVGKSSLINALLNNKNLAKSSSTPGKTRLVNVFVSKWQLNLLNSSLGTPFALVENFERSQTISLASRSKFSTNTKSPPQILELDLKANSAESSLRESRSDSWQSKQNNNVDCFGDESPRNDESFVDCHDSAFTESCNDENIKNANSTNPPKQTIEGIAVEVAEFLPNFECETRLGVCEHSKFGKSMQDAPKSKLPTQEFVIHILDFPGFGYAKLSKSERDSWDKNLSTFLKKRESIKLFIHLIDSRHTNLALDDEIRAFLRSIVRADADILEVFTKADKLKKSEIYALKGRILVSTTKKDLGQGDLKDSIESLRHAILRTMYHI